MFELCQVVEGGLEPEKQAAVSLPATAPAAGRRERKMTYLVCAMFSNFVIWVFVAGRFEHRAGVNV